MLTDVSNGKHSLTLYLVDESGVALDYTYSSATVNFIIGLNSSYTLKIYAEANAIESNTVFSMYLDVANMYLSDIYAPIDVQYVIAGDAETVLIAKLDSPVVAGEEIGEAFSTGIINNPQYTPVEPILI